MRDRIIGLTLDAVYAEGMRFSVDAIAEKLGISKKTVYKYFPAKGDLARAVYQTFYGGADGRLAEIARSGGRKEDALLLYAQSKRLSRGEVFNKFSMNEVIRRYAEEQNDRLWRKVAAAVGADADDAAAKLVIDSAFERLPESGLKAEKIIERLIKII